ncbi:choline transporter [Vreelandella utahensis]|uniref:choline transporter n=1 Tax=Vreelandella halophila TaxID=86177 RepID=UPI000986253D|nr:choline transporter [Halomonas utahensis]
MLTWLSIGLVFTFTMIAVILLRWGNLQVVGVTPVRTFTFMAILFTSGLDVGLIMFPLTEFGGYAEDYSVTNPLAIEFGFWAFLIWGFYFLTCFYFCVIEPRVKFFEIPLVKVINNVVIIGTCAFTAYLLLKNLPWYLPEMGDDGTAQTVFYAIVFISIAMAVYSSTSLKYVRVLSVSTSWMFIGLIALFWYYAFMTENGTFGDFAGTLSLLGGYFGNIHEFMLPLSDYHAFYLYWWFAWSIMIGQFTSRFVGGLRTWQLLLAMLFLPSIAIGIWFTVLYYYHLEDIGTTGVFNILMVTVGITMVINSLDSLIRLYTDNLNLTVKRFGKGRYFAGNLAAMIGLTLLFQLEFLKIQWVGALVIGIYFACILYIITRYWSTVSRINSSPEENKLDYSLVDSAN